MDSLCKKLFPGSGFAGDENIGVAAGGLGQKFQTRSDLFRISDNGVSFQNDRRLPRFSFRSIFQSPENGKFDGVERSRLL